MDQTASLNGIKIEAEALAACYCLLLQKAWERRERLVAQTATEKQNVLCYMCAY